MADLYTNAPADLATIQASLSITGGLFNWKPSNTKYLRKALASVRDATAHAALLFIGDSTTAGLTTNGANMPPKSWPRWLRDIMIGRGLPAFHASRFGPGGVVSGLTPSDMDTRLAMGVGWGATGPFGLGGYSFQNNSTTNPLSLTPVEIFDTIDVYYIRNSGLATFTVDVDGGAALATINSSGSTGLVKASVSCAAATHTINIKRTGVGTNAFIIGVVPSLSTTKSVQLLNVGAASSRAADWSPGSGGYSPLEQIAFVAAPCAFIQLGINDGVGGRTKAQYKADVLAIVTAQKTVGDAILMVPLPSASSSVPLATQSDYRDALYELAISQDIPLIDLAARFGPYATQISGVMADAVHSTTTGYADEAAFVATALGV